MMTKVWGIWGLLSLVTFNAEALPQKLVLLGGGYPPALLEKYVQCAGGEKAHILLVAWADDDSDGVNSIVTGVKSPRPLQWDIAPSLSEMENRRDAFVEQLSRATGVFFTGGSPTRLMDAIEKYDLISFLHEKSKAGACLGGTSAGMAIMPETMMTGQGDFKIIAPESVETRPGLGLLTGVLVDQHFLRRRRENRLFSLLLNRPESVALGIDENAGVILEDKKGEVMGQKPVMVIRREGFSRRMTVEILHDGDRFEL